jgi:membrane-bound transcription factor site-1 protease
VSFTAWFLDAFNYAIHNKMDVLNLSIGGPDFMDRPFVEKVMEVVSSGIIMISAIGNDGPLWGTLNNPADMNSVIGVGGLGSIPDTLARFSSRGMTTWELPGGYGRVKPDVATFSTKLFGPDLHGKCMFQSGTSMASPVIAGVVSALISSVSDRRVVNPGSIKQVLLESSIRLPKSSIFEQGSGRVNLNGAVALLQSYKPRVTAWPPYYDSVECPYFSPYCDQPMYHSSMPVIFNATIINGISVTGKFAAAPTFVPSNEGGKLLNVAFDFPNYLWPWSGYLGMRITIAANGATFDGVAEGVVTAKIITPQDKIPAEVKIPIRLRVIPTPERRKRLLWDQYHNARYPPGYFPRDDLLFSSSPFDWNADHIHTNFYNLYRYMRKLGFYVEVLGEPWSCFNASNYAALLVVDPEEEMWEEEQRKLETDIRRNGLSLLVLADWYNVDVMKALRFDDQNTQQQWTPVTGGAHLPALNDFLEAFGIVFTTKVVRGTVALNGRSFDYASGTTLGAFPKGGYLFTAKELYDQKIEFVDDQSNIGTEAHHIGGWLQVEGLDAGRIVVFGDASFVDGAGRAPKKGVESAKRGYWMMDDILGFIAGDLRADQLYPGGGTFLGEGPLSSMDELSLPRRYHMTSILRFSKILHRKQGGKAHVCEQLQYVSAKDQPIEAFDWQKQKTLRERNSRELLGQPIDNAMVLQVLKRKKRGIGYKNRYIPFSTIMWFAFGLVVVVLPMFLWYESRSGAKKDPTLNTSREKLIF